VRLLAALAWATTAYLGVGVLTGHAPRTLRRRRVRKARFETWLHQAGSGATPIQFLTVSAGAALLTFLVVWALAGAAPVAIVPALAVATAPRAWFERQRQRTGRERLRAWPDALRDLVAHLEGSVALHPALLELGRSGPEPLRPVWRRYGALASALDQRAALEAMRNDLASPVSDRILEVLIVAAEQGPAVVLDLLRDLAETTTDDIRLAEAVETSQLEQRIEARAVAVLPFVVLVMLTSRSEDYRDFYRSGIGVVVIVIGAAMTAVGSMVIRRLSRVREETRVLVGPAVGAS
jgi:tight adherence protein B